MLKKIYTGFKDKNNKRIHVGDICKTFDKTGKEWVGKIIHDKYGFYSFRTNYDTRIHHYWSKELTIIIKKQKEIICQ